MVIKEYVDKVHQKNRLKYNDFQTRYIEYNGQYIKVSELIEQQKHIRASKLLNIADTIASQATERGLIPIPLTITISSKDRLKIESLSEKSKIDFVIRKLSTGLKKFLRRVLDDNFFRIPTEKRKKQLGFVNDWIYTQKLHFSNIELQSDGNPHLHTTFFIENDIDKIAKFIEVIHSKRKLSWQDSSLAVGNTLIQLPATIERQMVQRLKLKHLKHKNRDNTYYSEELNDLGDLESFSSKKKIGHYVKVEFIHDELERISEKAKSILSYLLKNNISSLETKNKILLKDKLLHDIKTNKDDDTKYKKDRDLSLNDENAIFQHLRVRRVSYSKLSMSVRLYQSIRHFLIQIDEKFKKLSFAIKEFVKKNLMINVITKKEIQVAYYDDYGELIDYCQIVK